MKERMAFENRPLQQMVAVGGVEAHRVRLWMRSGQPGRFRILWWPEGKKEQPSETRIEIAPGNVQDNTTSFTIPADPDTVPALRSKCRYRFCIMRESDGHPVGEGGFETAPGAGEKPPAKFAIALMSCNQPFTDHGAIRSTSRDMLKAVKTCLRQHDTKFVLMVGDQMYSDYPADLSLFDSNYFATLAPPNRSSILECTAAETRRIYQRRYRHFWNLPEWQAIQSEWPCYPILDDHDIVDNWGSSPDHQSVRWKSLGEGARNAYFDYQGSRVFPPGEQAPPSFHYAFDYGPVATFVMDLRSMRRTGPEGQLFCRRQRIDLQRFLQRYRSRRILCIVLSVPVIHLPRYLARLAARIPYTPEDFSDRWSAGAHLRDRDWFLKLIHQHQSRHPQQRLILLSGDIHIGCVHRIRWNDSGPLLYQMISSPITHTTRLPVRLASKLLIRSNRRIATLDGRLGAKVELLGGTGGRGQNPYGGLNLGILEIQRERLAAEPQIRFLLYGHQGEKPVCVYRSRLL